VNLNDALKYTTDTVQTLLKELQKPEHNEHRWGTDQSKSLRAYLADALQDAVANHTDPAQIKSLEKQAELLRNPEQHVVVQDGQVRAGKFRQFGYQRSPWDKAHTNLSEAIHASTSGEVDPLESVFVRQVHYGDDVPAEGLWEASWYHNPEASHHQADTVSDGDIGYKRLPVSRMGNFLANFLVGEASEGGHELPTTGDHPVARAYEAMRNAPYEEVDADHPSERPQ
jgi:hypothetical protein